MYECMWLRGWQVELTISKILIICKKIYKPGVMLYYMILFSLSFYRGKFFIHCKAHILTVTSHLPSTICWKYFLSPSNFDVVIVKNQLAVYVRAYFYMLYPVSWLCLLTRASRLSYSTSVFNSDNVCICSPTLLFLIILLFLKFWDMTFFCSLPKTDWLKYWSVLFLIYESILGELKTGQHWVYQFIKKKYPSI